jgi:glycosyltransferase involved in cell wall biosynthesis
MESNSANKFFDALAAGRPVAINYGGWHRTLLQEHGAGLALPATDPAAAAGLLAALIGDEDALARCREGARALASERFDRDRLAEEFAGVLESVAAGVR